MFENLKSKLLKSIKSKKLNVFGFFLLLSFLFLVIAKLSKTYTETIAFHVNYTNVPEQYSITSDYDSVVNVKVRSYGFNLIAHNFFKHEITIDFDKEVRKGDHKYVWDTKNGVSKIDSQIGSKIEIISIQPDSLSFPYDVMTVKMVPIKLNADIKYAPGYDILDSLLIKPDSIKVIGPKNIVEKISRIKTEKLTLKDVNATIDHDVKLIINESMENVKLSKSKVKVTGVVEKFTEGTFEVPVDIVNLPSNIKINYFPKTVLVSYYVSLGNYKKIKALDFKIVCDYDVVKNQDRTFFIPQLVSKPTLVKSAKIKQNKIEYIIIK